MRTISHYRPRVRHGSMCLGSVFFLLISLQLRWAEFWHPEGCKKLKTLNKALFMATMCVLGRGVVCKRGSHIRPSASDSKVARSLFLTSDVWYWQKCLFFGDSSMIVSMGMCVVAWVCVCVSLCLYVFVCFSVWLNVCIFFCVCVKEIKAKEEGDRRWNLIDNVPPRCHLLLLDKITTSLRLHQEQAHYHTSWHSEKIFLIGQEEIVPPLKNFGTSICSSRLQHQWIRSAASSVASTLLCSISVF